MSLFLGICLSFQHIQRFFEFAHPSSSCVTGSDSLAEVKAEYARLSQLSHAAGTSKNHRRQITVYTEFCRAHGLRVLEPRISTVCYYLTYLRGEFISANSVRNYLSGVSFLHKCHGVPFTALQAFPVICLLRAIDVDMRRQPNQKLPITPSLLAQLVQLTHKLGAVGPPMKVALLFGFFAMLRVSNLAPASPLAFDPSRDTCRGDVLIKPPGVVLVLKWSKTLQTLSTTPLIPIPEIPGHDMDPKLALQQLLQVSPTTHPRQPLLMYTSQGRQHVLTSPLLNKYLSILITELGMEPSDFSFHSLRRGGATTAYHGGVRVNEVKRHGVWASDSFWKYITDPVIDQSPVAQALKAAVRGVGRGCCSKKGKEGPM